MWADLDENYRREHIEGCAIILSERLWKCVKCVGGVNSKALYLFAYPVVTPTLCPRAVDSYPP